MHVTLKGSHAEIIYVKLGERVHAKKKGERQLRLDILSIQIENQGKSKNVLCEFIANKAEFIVDNRWKMARSARIIY